MKKMLITGLAAIGVAGMISGGTFAYLSDFAIVEGNEVGGGTLVLEVGGPNGHEAIQVFDDIDLVPGGVHDRTRYLTSLNDDAVPSATLTTAIQGALTDHENGCASNSEADAEGNDNDIDDENLATACGGAASGEFSSLADLKIESSAPTTAGSCGTVSYTEVFNDKLANFAGDAALGTLAPGDGICVRMTISLDDAVGDEVQGDSTDFALRFDLSQVPS